MQRAASVYQVIASKVDGEKEWVIRGTTACFDHRDLTAYHLDRYVIGLTDCVWMVPGTWSPLN